MRLKRRELFTTVVTEGAILPADLLQRISDGDQGLDGLTPECYHLDGRKITEVISGAWNRLLGIWPTFEEAREKLPAHDIGTSITRERWLLPLVEELRYGRLQTTKAIEIEGKSYPISHFWQSTPIHLVGCNIEIDKRTPGVTGAARMSPHSMVQEFLNRSDDHLWGFLSNGRHLRILRDNVSLTRQAYVEFDLEAMMLGEVYSDFVLLWLLCHQSRVESERPETCWLEQWSQASVEQGTRALETLRNGVEEAIVTLGQGFLAHPRNERLREKLQTGQLEAQDYYRQLLRLVYRLIFLFVAEDRGLLLVPEADERAKERYLQFYSTNRMRQLAEKRRGSRHPDLYQALKLVMGNLGKESGCPELALPALGSFLWSKKAIIDIEECNLTNRNLLDAVRALAFVEEARVQRPVDYKNMGPEELGSIYEALLELHPEIHAEAATFDLNVAAGHERKTTGSYYTPTSLVNALLDSALEPVVEDRLKDCKTADEQEKAILKLKVCDPATGSGHFLVAAAHRLAKHLAAIRSEEEEPAPEYYQDALRDVIGHCIYGVDINPMAVELCKVSLWMEALEPGKPLSFLEQRIQCGNSLLGTTPALIPQGIPDEAFKPIEGDDKHVASLLKKRNRKELNQLQIYLALEEASTIEYSAISESVARFDAIPDDSLTGISRKEDEYSRLHDSLEFRRAKLVADTWCAAFVWRKTRDAPQQITAETFRLVQVDPKAISTEAHQELERLTEQYQFFHWHMAFPDVFHLPDEAQAAENKQSGWNGGFDVVIGNPPWEKWTIMEKEFFAGRNEEIAATTRKADRTRLIEQLRETNSSLYKIWKEAQRQSDGATTLVQLTGHFPLSAKGELNTYRPFTELGSQIINKSGRCGMVVKSSIFTSETAAPLMEHLTQRGMLVSLFDFRNWNNLFPAIGFHERFSLLTFSSAPQKSPARFAFYCDEISALDNADRIYELDLGTIDILSPNSGRVPILGTRYDSNLLSTLTTRFPVLVSENRDQNHWDLEYGSLFHMSGASEYFITLEELLSQGYEHQKGATMYSTDGPPVSPFYEGKYIQIYDHRFSSFENIPRSQRFGKKPRTHTPTWEQKANPDYEIVPRYWIPESVANRRLTEKLKGHMYYCAARRVTNVISNARTTMACIMPAIPANDMIITLIVGVDKEASEYAISNMLFISVLNSFAFDYVARLRVSENLLKGVLFEIHTPTKEHIVQAAWLGDKYGSFPSLIRGRVLELSYTSLDLRPFAQDSHYDGPPFIWNDERRFIVRSEIDAAYFHLYGIERDDVDYIMETFPIVKRKDEKAYGTYRTKDAILEIYDEMAECMKTGQPYQTRLDPPPGPPCDEEGNFMPMEQWDPNNWPVHIHRPREGR